MVWRVEISETGERQLGKLCKRNPGVADRLLKKLGEPGVLANPRSTGKAGKWSKPRHFPGLRIGRRAQGFHPSPVGET